MSATVTETYIEASEDRYDHDAEEVLNKYGIEYHYELVRLSDIDWVLSERNRGRQTPKDDATCTEYAAAMQLGDKFPAICCRKISRPSPNLVIAGGVHRAHAKQRCMKDTCLAIVVECNDSEFILLCMALNAINGARTTTRERLAQAAVLVDQHGWSSRDASNALSVDYKTLGNYLRSQRLAAMLIANGMKSSDVAKLADTKLLALSSTQSCPVVMLDMAKLLAAKGTQISTEEAKQMIADTMSLPTEQERLKSIMSQMRELKRTAKAPKSLQRPNRKRVLGIVTSIQSLLTACKSPAELQLDEEERRSLIVQWKKLSTQILTMLNG